MADMMPPPIRASFEEAWAVIRETGLLLKNLSAETDQKFKETAQFIENLGAKTDQQREEAARRREEVDREVKEIRQMIQNLGATTDKRLGDMSNRLGDLAEHLMSPKLHEKFRGFGFTFTHSSRNHKLWDAANNRLAEIDVLVENGEYAIAVEVKTHPKTEDVQDHLKRMEIVRQVADARQDTRKYLGALAGVVVSEQVIAYALNMGLYVILPSGETVEIAAPQGFKPRIW